MDPRILFPVLAVVLLVLAGARFIRNGRRLDPSAKTWLRVGLIFVAVSLWLYLQGRH